MKKIVSLLVCVSFIFQQVAIARASGITNTGGALSGAAITAGVSPFRPPLLRSISYDGASSQFRVRLDKGDAKESSEQGVAELCEYFLIGLSLPEKALWVNLRPDSPENIIDEALSKTIIGKIMLEADLQLKKDTALYTSPATVKGREYWEKLYKKAEMLFGPQATDIPTLTRPWIVPGEIIVGETGGSAYIYKASLRVMLEQDYLKGSASYGFSDPREKELNEYSSRLIRELILPQIVKDVNTASKYASLRQVYYSLILASWFKGKFKEGTEIYAQQMGTPQREMLASKESFDPQVYYKAYQKSFREGEYNVKENKYSTGSQMIRQYFAGGIDWERPHVRTVPITPPILNTPYIVDFTVSTTRTGDIEVLPAPSSRKTERDGGAIDEMVIARAVHSQMSDSFSEDEVIQIVRHARNQHPAVQIMWDTMEEKEYAEQALSPIIAAEALEIAGLRLSQPEKSLESILRERKETLNLLRLQEVGKQNIILFSGVPGAGKSTHLDRLAGELSSRGIEVFDPQKHGSHARYLDSVAIPVLSTDDFKAEALRELLRRQKTVYVYDGKEYTALAYYDFLMANYETLQYKKANDQRFTAEEDTLWQEINRVLNPEPGGPYESRWTLLLNNEQVNEAGELGIRRFHDAIRIAVLQGKSFLVESSGFNDGESQIYSTLSNNSTVAVSRVHFFMDTANQDREKNKKEQIVQNVINRPVKFLDVVMGGLGKKGIVDYIENWVPADKNEGLRKSADLVIERFGAQSQEQAFEQLRAFVDARLSKRALDVIEMLGREGYFDLKAYYRLNPQRQQQLIRLIEKFLEENGGLTVFKKGEIIMGPYKDAYKHRHHRGDGKYHVVMYGKARLVSQQSGLTIGESADPKIIKITSPAEFLPGNGFGAVAVAEDKDHWGDIMALMDTATFSLDRSQFARLAKLTLEWESEDKGGIEKFAAVSDEEMRILTEAGFVQAFPGQDNQVIMRILMINEVDKKKKVRIQALKEEEINRRINEIVILNRGFNLETGEAQAKEEEERTKAAEKRATERVESEYAVYEKLLLGHQFVYKTSDGVWRVFDDKIYAAAQRSNFLQYFLQNKNAQKENFQLLYDSMSNTVYLIAAQNLFKETPGAEGRYEFTTSQQQRQAREYDVYMLDKKSSQPGRVIITLNTGEEITADIRKDGLVDPLRILVEQNRDVATSDIIRVVIDCPEEWDVYRLDIGIFNDKIEQSSGYSIENLAIDVENQGYDVTNGDGQKLEELVRKAVREAQIAHAGILGHTDLSQKGREAVFDLIHFWVRFRNLSQASKNSGIDFVVLEILLTEYQKYLNDYSTRKVPGDLGKYQDVEERLRSVYQQEYPGLSSNELDAKMTEAWALLRMYLETELDPSVQDNWRYPKAKELLLPYLRKGTERKVVTGARATRSEFAKMRGLPEAIIIIPDVHEQTDAFLDWCMALGVVDTEDRLILSRGRVIQFQGDVANRLVGPEGMSMLTIIRDWHRQAEEFNRTNNLSGNDRMRIVMTMGNQDLDILRNDTRKQAGFCGEYRVGAVKSLLQELVSEGVIVAGAYYGDDANNGLQVYHAGLLPTVRKKLSQEMREHNAQVRRDARGEKAYSLDRAGLVMYINDILKQAIARNDFSHFIFGKSTRRGGKEVQSGIFEVDLGNFSNNDFFFELVAMGIVDEQSRLVEGMTLEKAQQMVNEEFGFQINGHSFDSGDAEQTRTMYRTVTMSDGSEGRLVFHNVRTTDTGRGQVENPFEQNTSSGVLVIAGGELYQANMDTRPFGEERDIDEVKASSIEYSDLTDDQKIEELSRARKPKPKVDGLLTSGNTLVNQRATQELTAVFNEIAGIDKDAPGPLDPKAIPTADLQLMAKYGTVLRVTGNIGQGLQEGDIVVGLSGTFRLIDAKGQVIREETIKPGTGNKGRIMARGPPRAEWNCVAAEGAVILILPGRIKPGLQEDQLSSLADLLQKFPSLYNTLYTIIPPAFSERYLDIVRYAHTIDSVSTDILVAGAKIFSYLEVARKQEKTDNRRIGIFPISANPFHLNHQKVILETLKNRDLDEIMVVVSAHHVSKEPLSALELAMRVSMLKATFKFDPRVSIVVVGDSYYKNIVKIIGEQEPNARLSLMMGIDNFEDTIQKDAIKADESPADEIRAILKYSDILVSTRYGKEDEYLNELIAQARIHLTPEERNQVQYHAIVQDNVSSSLIRVLVADGEEDVYPQFLDPNVVTLIREFGLYHDSSVPEADRRRVYAESRSLINRFWREGSLKHPERWEELVVEDSIQFAFEHQLNKYFTELFGSADIMNTISPEIWKGLSEWNETTKKVIMARMADGVAVYEALAVIRAQARDYFNKFEQDNPGRGAGTLLNNLAKWTHQSWLAGEKRNHGFIAYNQAVHDFLLIYVKQGLVTDNKGKEVDQSRFENPEDKFRILPRSIYERLSSDAERQEFLRGFAKATGRAEVTPEMVINTVGGEWDDLNAIRVGNNPDWDKRRPEKLFELQSDSVAAVLSCLTDSDLLEELASEDRVSVTHALVEMMRRVNLVWRLNNSWGGIGDSLLSKPFDIAANGGIGEDQILKDAIVLKEILSILQKPSGNVNIGVNIQQNLDLAFAGGLEDILTELTNPDMHALIKAVQDNVAQVGREFPATTGEYAAGFGNQAFMDRYTNSPDVWNALSESDKEKLASIRKRMAMALAVFESLVTVRAQALDFFIKFEEKNPGRGAGSILNMLAELTHQKWLGGEKSKKGFISYNQAVHDFLLFYVKQDLKKNAQPDKKEKLVIDSKGNEVSPERFENPEDKFRILPIDIYNRLSSDVERREFLRGFLQVTGETGVTPEMVINTVGGEWAELNAIKVSNSQWDAKRAGYLFKLQRDSVAAILNCLADEALLQAIAGTDEEARIKALVEMARRVNLVWRLNNPWGGIEDPLLSRPFDLAENGGIGIEDILKDVIVLSAILGVLYDHSDTITLPGNIKGLLNLAFSNGLQNTLDKLEDKELLAKTIQADRDRLIKSRNEEEFHSKIVEVDQQLQLYFPSLLPQSVTGFALSRDGGVAGQRAIPAGLQRDGGEILNMAMVGMRSELQPQYSTTAALYALASYLTDRFGGTVDARTFDMYADHSLEIEAIADNLVASNTGVVCLTIPHNTVAQASQLFNLINEKADKVGKQRPLFVLGGAIPSFRPLELLQEHFPGAYIISGEGEEPLRKFVEYAQGRRALEEVNGLVFLKSDGQLVSIPLSELELSAKQDEAKEGVARGIARLSDQALTELVRLNQKGAMIYIEASRGCPWGHCQFCAGRNMYGKWRGRNLEDVLYEVEFLINNGVESFHFADEEFFGPDIDRARIFAGKLVELREKSGKSFSFTVSARADSIYNDDSSDSENEKRKEVLAILKNAGLSKVFLGIESGSSSQLKRFNKGMSVNEAEHAARAVKENVGPTGLDVGFIMFDPEVTFAEIAENADFIKRNNLLNNISWFLNTLKISTNTPMAKRYANKKAYSRVALTETPDINMLTYGYSFNEDGMTEFVSYAELLFEFTSTLNYALKSIRWGGMIKGMETEFDTSIALLDALQDEMFDSFLEMTNIAQDGSIKDKAAEYAQIRTRSLEKQIAIVKEALERLDHLAARHEPGQEAEVFQEIREKSAVFITTASKVVEARRHLRQHALGLLHGDLTTRYAIGNTVVNEKGVRFEFTASENSVLERGALVVSGTEVTLYDEKGHYVESVVTGDEASAKAYQLFAEKSIVEAARTDDSGPKKELLARAADHLRKAFDGLEGKAKREFALRMKAMMVSPVLEERVASALCVINLPDISGATGPIIHEDMRLAALEIIMANRPGIIMYNNLTDVIDMHCHTFRSDGAFSPSFVVFDAWRRGLRAVGIVDHNTLSGFYEAWSAGKILGIDVIAGVEFDVFDTPLNISNFHLLGYFSPNGAISIREYSAMLQTALGARGGANRVSLEEQSGQFIERDNREVRKYIELFNTTNKEGWELTDDDLIGFLTAYPNRYQLGKALFAKYGAQILGVDDFRSAANKFFPKGALNIEGADGVDIDDVLAFFRQTGATVVLPHPGEKMSGKPMFAPGQVTQVLEKYAGKIHGIEVFSSKHSAEDVAAALQAALQAGLLIISQGSDAHDQETILLGRGRMAGDLSKPGTPGYVRVTEFLEMLLTRVPVVPEAVTAAPGGIDFRVLPVSLIPSGERLLKELQAMPGISFSDLDREWGRIEKMVAMQMIPSTQRMKEYLGACCRQGELQQRTGALMSCLTDILRLEEKDCKTTETDFKAIFAVLGHSHTSNFKSNRF